MLSGLPMNPRRNIWDYRIRSFAVAPFEDISRYIPEGRDPMYILSAFMHSSRKRPERS
jgi:hypothetical protein